MPKKVNKQTSDEDNTDIEEIESQKESDTEDVKKGKEKKDDSDEDNDKQNSDEEDTKVKKEPKKTKEPNEIEESSNPILKENVIAYLQINNIIAEKREEMKELIKKKCKYEEYLKVYLERENKSKIETNDGDIIFKKQTSKQPLKEDIIEKAIVNKFKDVKKVSESGVKIAHDILEEVNNMRGVNVKSNIRYVKKKGKK